MCDFFNVIGLHVWNVPDIAWVFPFGVSAEFAFVLTLVMAFAGILLRNANGVYVEIIAVPFGEPQNRFVPSAKPSCAVKSVPERPCDPITKNHFRMVPHD